MAGCTCNVARRSWAEAIRDSGLCARCLAERIRIASACIACGGETRMRMERLDDGAYQATCRVCLVCGFEQARVGR